MVIFLFFFQFFAVFARFLFFSQIPSPAGTRPDTADPRHPIPFPTPGTSSTTDNCCCEAESSLSPSPLFPPIHHPAANPFRGESIVLIPFNEFVPSVRFNEADGGSSVGESTSISVSISIAISPSLNAKIESNHIG